jgi:hypothetical protein
MFYFIIKLLYVYYVKFKSLYFIILYFISKSRTTRIFSNFSNPSFLIIKDVVRYLAPFVPDRSEDRSLSENR